MYVQYDQGYFWELASIFGGIFSTFEFCLASFKLVRKQYRPQRPRRNARSVCEAVRIEEKTLSLSLKLEVELEQVNLLLGKRIR